MQKWKAKFILHAFVRNVEKVVDYFSSCFFMLFDIDFSSSFQRFHELILIGLAITIYKKARLLFDLFHILLPLIWFVLLMIYHYAHHLLPVAIN